MNKYYVIIAMAFTVTLSTYASQKEESLSCEVTENAFAKAWDNALHHVQSVFTTTVRNNRLFVSGFAERRRLCIELHKTLEPSTGFLYLSCKLFADKETRDNLAMRRRAVIGLFKGQCSIDRIGTTIEWNNDLRNVFSNALKHYCQEQQSWSLAEDKLQEYARLLRTATKEIEMVAQEAQQSQRFLNIALQIKFNALDAKVG